MPKLNLDREKLIFFVLIIFLALEIFVLFPWAIDKIVRLSKEAADLKTKLIAIEKDWPKKDSYLDQEAKLKEEVDKQKSSFISLQQESKLLSFISQNSKNFAVEIESIVPKELKDYLLDKSGKLKYLPIEIKMRSNFHNLALFLDYLQNSQYFFEVKELKITYAEGFNYANILICGLVE
ncbi:MAG: type 4a pilus biogenesis protein PilO [Candidatus Omnitrophica bacterium]|jgi:Tfp pilus assembly protein PilO|nr:type 4a pilus biogenesis protein PilO [Candidatus Omnitrophota bacterium]